MCLQGYEVRKITAIDQDLGRPRGIGYTIISGLSHIINLTSTAQRRESITSYHNPTAIIDKSHQAPQSITAETSAELKSSFAHKHTLITVSCSCAEVSRRLVLSLATCLMPSKQDYSLTVWQILPSAEECDLITVCVLLDTVCHTSSLDKKHWSEVSLQWP